MRIALVDDSERDRGDLRLELARYFEGSRLPVEYEEFGCAEDFLLAFQPSRFQIVFLDIYMKSMTGIDAARAVYRTDPLCRLVFLTTSHAHAAAGYEVQARFYLQKPLDSQKLRQAMDICLRGLGNDGELLTVRVEGIDLSVPHRSILYLDCVDRVPQLHLEKKVLSLSEPLGSVTQHLSGDHRFYSCNRGILVNLRHVAAVEQSCFLLRNGERLPIRQKGLLAAKKALLEYSLQQLCGEGEG